MEGDQIAYGSIIRTHGVQLLKFFCPLKKQIMTLKPFFGCTLGWLVWWHADWKCRSQHVLIQYRRKSFHWLWHIRVSSWAICLFFVRWRDYLLWNILGLRIFSWNFLIRIFGLKVFVALHLNSQEAVKIFNSVSEIVNNSTESYGNLGQSLVMGLTLPKVPTGDKQAHFLVQLPQFALWPVFHLVFVSQDVCSIFSILKVSPTSLSRHKNHFLLCGSMLNFERPNIQVRPLQKIIIRLNFHDSFTSFHKHQIIKLQCQDLQLILDFLQDN